MHLAHRKGGDNILGPLVNSRVFVSEVLVEYSQDGGVFSSSFHGQLLQDHRTASGCSRRFRKPGRTGKNVGSSKIFAGRFWRSK